MPEEKTAKAQPKTKKTKRKKRQHNYLYFYLFEGVPVLGVPWVTPLFFAVLVFSAFFGLYYLSKLIMMLRKKYIEKKALETK